MSEGEGNLGWRAGLPADLQGNETFASFKTVGEFGKAHLDLLNANTESATKLKDLEGKLGKAVFIPGNDATDEEKAAYRKALGVPEAADKYTITKPATFPESVPYDPAGEKWMAGMAFKYNLPNEVAQGLYADYGQFMADVVKAEDAKLEQSMKESVETLHKDPEWAGEKFKVNQDLIGRLLKKFGGEELFTLMDVAKLGGQRLGDHPAMAKMFLAIAKAIGEDSLGPAGSPGGGPAETGGLSYPSMKE